MQMKVLALAIVALGVTAAPFERELFAKSITNGDFHGTHRNAARDPFDKDAWSYRRSITSTDGKGDTFTTGSSTDSVSGPGSESVDNGPQPVFSNPPVPADTHFISSGNGVAEGPGSKSITSSGSGIAEGPGSSIIHAGPGKVVPNNQGRHNFYGGPYDSPIQHSNAGSYIGYKQ